MRFDKRGRKTGKLFLLLVVILISYYFYYKIDNADITGKTTQETNKEYGKDIQVLFCPRDNCTEAALGIMNQAQSTLHCAFYDLNLVELMALLDAKSKNIDVKLVYDKDNEEDVLDLNIDKKTNPGYQLMHNKFCIIDNKMIFTGSFNPTMRDAYTNNNNLMIIPSADLASNYETEFQELWEGQFGKGERNSNPVTYYNNIKIENYFCPEDWCANKVIYALAEAKTEIKFMTFSFTHDGIGDMLIKKHNEGVKVSGVFEKTQNNAYTEYERLQQNGIDVRWDGNKGNMHHKVFIIDDQIVVLGSFNPSANADEKNDENLLIVHDPGITGLYSNEFSKVWQEAQTS